MPQFKPFKGIRPIKEIAGRFATRSVDSYSRKELDEIIDSNPESFFQIINSTWKDEDLSMEERHQNVRKKFLEFAESENIEKDKSSFYVYQLTTPEEETIQAVIGLVSMDDYEKGEIKKHEETLTNRVKIFSEYLLDIHFNAEPVLLTYKHNQRVDLLMELEMRRTPVIEFTDDHNVTHKMWQVDNRLNIRQIKESIERSKALYIADGHHRMESSLRYTKEMRSRLENPDEYDEINYAMAMLISDKELVIKDFNRVVKDLNGMTNEEFLEKLKENFQLAKRGETPFFPAKKHHFGLYMDGEFYSLYAGRTDVDVEGLSELDTFIFDEFILKPILDIQDSKEDDRVGFARGTGDIDGVIRLKEIVDSGKFKAAFFFYPVVAQDLETIADLGLKMPPKSTYIEPKPLSGLVLYQTKE